MKERKQHEKGHSSKIYLLEKTKPNVILVVLICDSLITTAMSKNMLQKTNTKILCFTATGLCHRHIL